MARVRPATPDDARAMRALHTAAVRELGATAYDKEQVEAWAAPDADRDGFPFDDPDHYLVVATRDGDVAGFGQLHVPEQEVVADYVHPDHVRQGVGSILLAHLEGYARGLGFDYLELTASMNAVAFYEHHGYEVFEETELDRSHRVDGAVLPVAVMEKPLPDKKLSEYD